MKRGTKHSRDSGTTLVVIIGGALALLFISGNAGILTNLLSGVGNMFGLGAGTAIGSKLLGRRNNNKNNDSDNSSSGSGSGSGSGGGGSKSPSEPPLTPADFSGVSDPFSSPDLSKIKPATADDIAHGTLSSRFKPQSIDDLVVQNPILPSGKPTSGSSGTSIQDLLKSPSPMTGKPTVGDSGTSIQDLLKSSTKKPSKTDRKKKSDNKKPKKLNNTKDTTPTPVPPKDCGFLGLLCLGDKLKGVFPILKPTIAPEIPVLVP
jgi:hypothetical protein